MATTKTRAADKQQQHAPRKPTHRFYRVIGEGKPRDGPPSAPPGPQGRQGFSLQCDAVPLQGRLVMWVITERDEMDEAA